MFYSFKSNVQWCMQNQLNTSQIYFDQCVIFFHFLTVYTICEKALRFLNKYLGTKVTLKWSLPIWFLSWKYWLVFDLLVFDLIFLFDKSCICMAIFMSLLSFIAPVFEVFFTVPTHEWSEWMLWWSFSLHVLKESTWKINFFPSSLVTKASFETAFKNSRKNCCL